MTFPMDTLQVQLVNAWWEQIIPVAALVISLFSVALTLLYRYFDRLNLSVKVEWLPVLTSGMQPYTGLDRVTVEVTNKSRSATTEITSLTLQSSEKRALNSSGRPWKFDSDLPISLGPGQSASRSYAAQIVGDTLNNDARGVQWLQALAVSGHKSVRSKRYRAIVQRLRDYARKHPVSTR